MLILILPSFFKFHFFLLSLLYNTYGHFFSVKDFSATIWVRILKLSTKLDSDELYCVTKKATYCLPVPLFVHFSFSPMEISVTDFSAPIGASVLKFWLHLQEGKVYCVIGNKDAKAHFAFFFNFSFCHSYIYIWTFFVRVFSSTT